jgi:hypothetical protein
MFTTQQIQENYKKFLTNLANCIPDNEDRFKKLYKYYDDRATEIATIPASSNLNHHSAFVGGYVYHVNNVYEYSMYLYSLWHKLDGVEGFTKNELLFAAIHHDMGKIGSFDNILYQPVSDKWKLDKGMFYEYNSEVSYMSIPDRSLYLLQGLGISLTENEYIAIKIHDGVYEDANRSYYMSPSAPRLKNNIAYILHQADMMAARLEYSQQQKFVLSKANETKSTENSLITQLKKL